MYVNRGQWFFGDEWDFLANRSTTIGDDGVLQPHNEHWSTTPILIYGLLFRMVGLTSYAPYVAVLVATHLVVVHLIWRVMLRGGIAPWVATAFSAAFIPFGPGAENLLWAFQVGFVGAVALGLAGILIADRPSASPRRVMAGWGVSVLSLTFSGIAVPLAGATAVTAWMRRGVKAFLLVASVPAAVYVAWLAATGVSAVPGPRPTPESLRVFHQFFGRSVGAVLSLGTSSALAGAVLLVLGLAAIGLRRRRAGSFPEALVAAALGWVFLLLIVSVGRAPLGLDAAEATRYVYVGGALLLPVLVLGISDLVRHRIARVLVVAALAAPWGAHNALLLMRTADRQAEKEGLIREQLVAAGTLFDRDAVLRYMPDPVFSPDLDLGELDELLPSFPTGVVPERAAVIRAATALQVSLSTSAEFDASPPISSIRSEYASLTPQPDGCVVSTAALPVGRVLVPSGPASSVRVTPTEQMAVELFLASRSSWAAYRDRMEVLAGRPLFLDLAIDRNIVGDVTVVLRFPGTVTICPLGG